MKEGYKPINTEKSIKLAPKNFTAWKEACVKANLDACPDDTLLSSEPSILWQWLSRYAAETKTTAGKSYHPSIHLLFTSYLLVCCGTRVMRIPMQLTYLTNRMHDSICFTSHLTAFFEIFVPRMLVPLRSMHSHSRRKMCSCYGKQGYWVSLLYTVDIQAETYCKMLLLILKHFVT